MSSTRIDTARLPDSKRLDSDARPSLPESFDNRTGSFGAMGASTSRFPPSVNSAIELNEPSGSALAGQSTSCTDSGVISIPYFSAVDATSNLRVSTAGMEETAEVSAAGAGATVCDFTNRSAMKIDRPPNTTASPTIGMSLPFTLCPCAFAVFRFRPSSGKILKRRVKPVQFRDNSCLWLAICSRPQPEIAVTQNWPTGRMNTTSVALFDADSLPLSLLRIV